MALLLMGLAALVALRWRRIGRPAPRMLLVMGAAAPPLGLLLLGAVFGTTPIELRYLCFATPFLALLLAGAIGTLPRAGPVLGAVVVAVQVLALAGMLTRPETMQPARAAARAASTLAGPNGIVLLPRGNDGVGVVGPFLAESPDAMKLALVYPEEPLAHLRAEIGGSGRVVLALLGQDGSSRAALPVMRAAVADGCWREVARARDVAAFARTCPIE